VSLQSAQDFLARYLTDEMFRQQVDSAEEGSGFARQAGYDFTPEELETAARDVTQGGAQAQTLGAEAAPALDIPTLTARALYGTWPWGQAPDAL
jgi:predicted ribosomally synthesized peptide with nif11-like leader